MSGAYAYFVIHVFKQFWVTDNKYVAFKILLLWYLKKNGSLKYPNTLTPVT